MKKKLLSIVLIGLSASSFASTSLSQVSEVSSQSTQIRNISKSQEAQSEGIYSSHSLHESPDVLLTKKIIKSNSSLPPSLALTSISPDVYKVVEHIKTDLYNSKKIELLKDIDANIKEQNASLISLNNNMIKLTKIVKENYLTGRA